MTFAKRLAGLRARAGLSGREFYTWLDVPKATCENWLRGIEPRRYTLMQLEAGPLKALERELARETPRLPPPLTIRHKDRLAYVQRIRSHYR